MVGPGLSNTCLSNTCLSDIFYKKQTWSDNQVLNELGIGYIPGYTGHNSVIINHK